MKHKTSISLDTATMVAMMRMVRTGLFRNRSHIVEFSVKKLVREIQKKNLNNELISSLDDLEALSFQ
ncbi:hypothetical protein KY330_05555 [Candidatus Woesearchaeota archaeon]|nr:hypothetical protein [Candidatus Woesearchaeota archaeon]